MTDEEEVDCPERAGALAGDVDGVEDDMGTSDCKTVLS